MEEKTMMPINNQIEPDFLEHIKSTFKRWRDLNTQGVTIGAKKIIQGNEKRKRRMLNGNASAFDRMAYSVINEALNNSCHNIDSEAAREQMQKQIYKSVVHCTPYESIYDVMCGRRQFYDYRNEFITAVAEGLGMLPGSRTKRNTGCSSTTGT